MKRYMKDVHSFRSYFTQSNQPHYFRGYVEGLGDNKLNWLYNQMKEPLEFLKEESYLLHKFKWINEYEFDDLSKEIFLQSIFNVEGNEEDYIKDKWYNILWERYEKDIQGLFEEFYSS